MPEETSVGMDTSTVWNEANPLKFWVIILVLLSAKVISLRNQTSALEDCTVGASDMEFWSNDKRGKLEGNSPTLLRFKLESSECSVLPMYCLRV
jgi:hypothetical protein